MATERAACPPVARQLATVTSRTPSECLLVGGINFYYRRGSHLTPPHQIQGLARRFVPRALEHFGIRYTRHLAANGTAGLSALAAAELPVIVRTDTGEALVRRVDAANVYVDEHDGVCSIPHESFVDDWMTAMPGGVWYSVGWSAGRPEAPPRETLWAAVRDTAYDVMVCSGAWQGVDGIEQMSEELVHWPAEDDWTASAVAASERIRTSDGLWRGAYALALDELRDVLDVPPAWCEELTGVADRWCEAADLLAQAGRTGNPDHLAGLASRLLGLAAAESRFWDRIIKRSEPHI